MADAGFQTLIFIGFGCLLVGLAVGLAVGLYMWRLASRGQRREMQALERAHEEYRGEVRDHFEQTSHIMSRMVDDYRRLYDHVSGGAGKLANMRPERVVTPSPSPDRITSGHDAARATQVVEQQSGAPADIDTPDADDSSPPETEQERARRLSGQSAGA